ncbi:MAG TPA: glycoside hydrolase, partial [Candidatus Caccovicinus merdipullorum]|nr:glycoside hydrolase [Candidatus Caccovicinus merdipullorum]
MKKKRFLKKWVAGTLLAGVLSMQMFAVPAFARLEEQLTVQNGQFIRANGTAIEGALAKGVTVSKYQNRAGTI